MRLGQARCKRLLDEHVLPCDRGIASEGVVRVGGCIMTAISTEGSERSERVRRCEVFERGEVGGGRVSRCGRALFVQ